MNSEIGDLEAVTLVADKEEAEYLWGKATELLKFPHYAQYILENPRPIEGRCQEESRRMAREFPELQVVKGTVQIIGPFGTEHTATHYWCETALEQIVDPTAAQFVEILSYRKIAKDGEDVSRCMNCGKHFAGTGCVCSPACMEELNSDF